MLKIFHCFAILHLLQGIIAMRVIDKTTIVEKGRNATVECNNSCNFDSLLWSYKPPNEAAYEDLVVMGSGSIRNKIPGRRDQWFEVINDTNCRRNLLLPKIQFEAAGVYVCWEGLVVKGVTNVIVVRSTSTELNYQKMDAFNILLTIAVAIVVFVFLFLFYLKMFSKLCFAHNPERRNIGDVASGISDGYAGIKKDLRPEDNNTYEVIADGHHDSIDDPPQSVCVESHLPVVE